MPWAKGFPFAYLLWKSSFSRNIDRNNLQSASTNDFKTSIVKSAGLSSWANPCGVIIASIFRKYPHLKLLNTGVCGEHINQCAWSDNALYWYVAALNWALTFVLSLGGATTLHFFKLLFTSSATMASDSRFDVLSLLVSFLAAFSLLFLFISSTWIFMTCLTSSLHLFF